MLKGEHRHEQPRVLLALHPAASGQFILSSLFSSHELPVTKVPPAQWREVT
jgi:hypothetical protein